MISTIIAYTVSLTITTLAILAKHTIRVILYTYSAYPQVASAVFLVLLTYATYRFTTAVVSWWIRMVVRTVKVFFFIFVLLAVGSISLRGYNQFFRSDLPLIRALWGNNAQTNWNPHDWTGQDWSSYFGNFDFSGIQKEANNFYQLYTDHLLSEPTAKPKTKKKTKKANMFEGYEADFKKYVEENEYVKDGIDFLARQGII